MNQDIPSTSSDAECKSGSPRPPSRRNRKRNINIKLPTPPPDPRDTTKENCTENEFLEYLENLQKHTANYSKSTSTLASALVAEDAFDHLERLYKLMEQMIELRAQNARLHRKIQDLEHLNKIEKMYKDVENSAGEFPCPELDQDTAFAETILESILCEPRQQSTMRPKSSLRYSLIKKQRNRSSSAIDKPVGLLPMESTDLRRASLCVTPIKKSSKVSKWTRVKAAFKWEKAAPNMSEMKSSDCSTPPIEIARYLKVPISEETGHNRLDSGTSEVLTPGSLSSASSIDNFHLLDRRCLNEEIKSSDEEQSQACSSYSKDDPNHSPKSLSSPRSERTPWAKMKEIISTHNPVRKKSRVSTHSDDIQIDIELCSDNEDVFEDNSKITIPASPVEKQEIETETHKKRENDSFEDSEPSHSKKLISKWLKVRKAFLQGHENHNESTSVEDEHEPEMKGIQLEIERNYRNLQKKLSFEFQEKMNEWNKIKQNSSLASSPTPSCNQNEEIPAANTAFMKKIEEWERIKAQPSTKQKASIPMTSEENLPPEFRKKLQEWEKIKKSSIRKSTKKMGELPRWKSMQQPTASSSDCGVHGEVPVISEEFKKKMEEWKQIKANTGYKSDDSEKKSMKNKTPSPKLKRMNSKDVQKDDKQIQWFEKELNKIEKERGRLEKERQKFIEREERLSKLRKTVTGGNKKDILVHTPSGFYKFEGISRKFTQKLYEWEKSKGIGPESSTFAFLSPETSMTKPVIPKVKINGKDHTPPLGRSRSADSVVTSALNAPQPLVKQPSSLSLNDMEELEKECLADSKTSLSECLTFCVQEAEEPEALIVEIEDIVEETAAPLNDSIQHHNPVYQREENRFLNNGETFCAPNIRRSESSRAQTNYSLIEDALLQLRHLSENENEIIKLQERNGKSTLENERVKELNEHQKLLSVRLSERLRNLQDENVNFISSLTNQTSEPRHNIVETLEIVQDFSNEISLMTEKLANSICYCSSRMVNIQAIQEIKSKVLELRRQLSYICAALDSTPNRGKLRRTSIVSEKSENIENHEVQPDHLKPKPLYIKSDTKNTTSQGAVKKRIRYKVENTRRKSLQDSDEEEYYTDKNEKKKIPKFMRSRTLSESSSKVDDETEIIEKKCTITPIVSKPIYVEPNSTDLSPLDSPVTIFVKTTRKLFTPIAEKQLKDSSHDNESVEICSLQLLKDSKNFEHEEKEIESKKSTPSSPSAPQKKNMAPNIRLMLAQYNQKLSGHNSVNKLGGNSGSVSPVAWRSPTAIRRVKAQTEKYLEQIEKSSGQDVKKSSSQGFISVQTNPEKFDSEKHVNVLKSCSASHLIHSVDLKRSTEEDLHSSKLISALRVEKLKKAREDFLNSGPSSASSHARTEDVFPNYKRNRLSQISVISNNSSSSSTSPGILTKSISAGMINVDEETYRNFEGLSRECVSLPRNIKKSKSTFSNITAKFKKVRMRKGKEKASNDLPAVSELCRQSLVVDLNESNQQNLGNNCGNHNQNSSRQQSGLSKSSSWIRAKIFKK